MRRLTTMINQSLEFQGIVVGQAFDGCFTEHRLAETPVQLQLATIDLTVDFQPVAQRCLRALLGTAGISGRREQSWLFATVEAGIELPQIVEGDTWLRQGRQRLLRCGITQVTQGTEPQALVGHGSQLLLDAFEGSSQGIGRYQLHRVKAGEPTDSASQVDVIEQIFAAMTFKPDQRRSLAAPARNNSRQGSQQQVIDLGAIGTRRVVQQAPSIGGIQMCAHTQGQLVAQARLWIGARQTDRTALQLRLPPSQLVL
ncbi:hypothetical protein PFLmoz3_04501 [Pseudomonas fluorescens]|uniref:Uncharacterized protein n=1 Tax=Pseudomonas fluorescens TaxID=294 RepID=A0A120G6L0_PSEFL|nr:hypothetical protein PFLmoz3_04501 [Pseudomonas fluorescens]